jgi:phage-related protein (TIGR01555 family)
MQNGGRIRPNSVALKAGVQLNDGLISLISGMGTTTDPRTFQRYHARYMTDYDIDQAYRGSAPMRRAIDKPATEMVREWRDWQADSGDIEKLEAEERRLHLRQKVRHAEILRGLGGAGMVLYVPDADQMQPLNPATIKAGGLKHIHVWHRSRFCLGQMIGDWSSEWFGHPEYFEVALLGATGAVPTRFHPSRVVVFKADAIGDILGGAWNDWYWGQSKVQTIMDAIMNVDTAENGFAALIKDARNRRISIPKLLEMLSTAGGEAILSKRLQAFALGESSNSVSWLDGGDGEGKGAEKIEDRQMNWAGMPDIMASYRTAAAAAAEMPGTVMWGTSPQGMNATGDSDIQLWHKTIRGRQDLDLRPCMTQIDAALIPSALGKVDDKIWYDWAPLSEQNEKDEATTFWNFMQGFQIAADSRMIPDIAMSKGLQNLLSERGWIPGLDDALAEIPENERFPELEQPGTAEPDPSALVATGNGATGGKEVIGVSAGGGTNAPARRAVNDAVTFFADATPRPLYVQRKLLNAAPLIAWAKANGFTSTLAPDDMHVTVLYSKTPVDPMKMGEGWSGDDMGRVMVKPGGPRAIERLGPSAVVLLFASWDIQGRHSSMVDAGGSHDFPEYQPHVTISYEVPEGVDLTAIKPYAGALEFGPELFEPLDLDWKSKVVEDEQRRPFGDEFNPDQPRDPHGRWSAGSSPSSIRGLLRSTFAKPGEHFSHQIGVADHRVPHVEGFARRIQASGVMHALAEHGNRAKEAAKTPKHYPITRTDITRIPAIVAAAHTVKVHGTVKGGRGQSIEHVARIKGREYHYVESVGVKREQLTFKTMWKL